MNKYISLDCETGGIGLDKSLLTVGLVLYNENLEEVDYVHYYVKPNDGVYLVTGKALEINQINLETHDKRAFTYRECGTSLYKLLNTWSDNGYSKLIPIGKQISGDLAQIWDKLITRSTWENFVSYRVIEVSSVMLFLQQIKLLPEFKGSLSDCANHYKIPTEGLHDALADARMTAKVYRAMLEDTKCKLGSTVN